MQGLTILTGSVTSVVYQDYVPIIVSMFISRCAQSILCLRAVAAFMALLDSFLDH